MSEDFPPHGELQSIIDHIERPIEDDLIDERLDLGYDEDEF